MQMKSPFTGGKATLKKEYRVFTFRKEEFNIVFQFYKCEETGEQFTDDQLDEVNINQVHNQYRVKYGIPFHDEIKAIRDQYDLAASKMAEILGIGINLYRNYEAGEMPSVSNGRLIQLAKDPKELLKMVDYSRNEFSPEELEKINKKIYHALHDYNSENAFYEVRMLGEKRPGILNGYKAPNLTRINNMILFFSEKAKPFKTKLNKLLFYADFLHFKRTCFSISGLTYQAIQKGPVPKNYDWIFDDTMEKKLVTVKLVDFGDYMGEKFIPTGQVVFDESLFSESELNVMKEVAASFEDINVNAIVHESHKERAWSDNIEEMKTINYSYGFDLKF